MSHYYFLGISLPEGVDESIKDFRSKFPKLGNLKTEPHITLTAPLKCANENELPLLQIGKAFKAVGQLDIQFGPVGNFGNRILYLEVSSTGLVLLQAKLAELWSIKESRPFHPHITILNNRKRDDTVSMDSLKQLSLETFQNGEFSANHLTLYQRQEGESYQVSKIFSTL